MVLNPSFKALWYLDIFLHFFRAKTEALKEEVKTEEEKKAWINIFSNSIKESLKTMVLRTSTWTVLIYVALLITFSGNNH